MDSGLRIRLRRLRALAGDAVVIVIKSIRIATDALEVPFRQFVAVPILLRLMDTDVGVFRRAGVTVSGLRVLRDGYEDQIEADDERPEAADERNGEDDGEANGLRYVLRPLSDVHSFTITAARANRG